MSEKVLLVCTSIQSKVDRALRTLTKNLFANSQVDILCRRADLPSYQGRSEVRQVLIFPNRRDLRQVSKFWLHVIREKYHAVAVLWCLDKGWNRAKLFALFCGSPRILVFNEHLDCDYLSPRFLKALVVARASNGTLVSSSLGKALLRPLKDGYYGILRIILFPIRVSVLLAYVAGLYLNKARIRNKERPEPS